MAIESHSAAIAQIATIQEAEAIDCEFKWVDGYLTLADGTPEDFLDQELAAALRGGMKDVVKLSDTPLPQMSGRPCLRFAHQGSFHPLRYLSGLARAINRLGGRIFTHTHAEKIRGGSSAFVEAGGHTIKAESIVVATNSPVNDRLVIHTKQAGYTTYVVGVRIPRDSVPSALYWDTAEPYHYVRLQRDFEGADHRDILIVGGEDHKTGQETNQKTRFARLEAWAREHFPMMETVEFAWSGQVMETVDGVAFIGRNPLDHSNVYVITGDSGMGMTHGTIGGLLITDLISNRPNRWGTLYDPSRKTLRATGTFLREASNMAAQYADWFKAGDVDSADEIACGEGGIVRQGLKKMAVYRDRNGKVHERSAVCPHLGGLVRWNVADRTWDCPCHGSRFDRHGVVIQGPANQNLSESDHAEQSAETN
jgi:glycine/D-amino acid oxidase-like deaminating enzyme/nitrite reductase/ring-hydroxylating ferredoxin subunit